MRTSPVRKDGRGIYVINNGQKHRPGDVVGYSHAYRMDSAGLHAGDRVVVRNVSQSPLCKVCCYDLTGKTPEWVELYWMSEDQYYEEELIK